MSRSPIEMMVDKACGIDKPPMPDAFAQALLNVADAAKKWAQTRHYKAASKRADDALLAAVKEWVRLGG